MNTVTLTLSSTRKLEAVLTAKDLEAMADNNTEVKITLIAAPTGILTPTDQDDPLEVKLKVSHIETVRTTNFTE